MSNIVLCKNEYTPTGVAIITEDHPKVTEIMPIKAALDGFLINTMSDDDLYNDLADVVGTAYILMQYTPPGKTEADIFVNEILSELRRRPVNIRRNELIIAVKNGLQGDYGEFIGLSPNRICKFIYAYVKDAERLNELAKRNMRSGPKPPPTKDQLFNICLDNAKQAFENFKSSGTCGRLGSPVYEFLTKYGILSLDTPKKKEYYQLATDRVKSDIAHQMKHAKSKKEHDIFKEQLLKQFGGTNEGQVIAMSKTLVVDNLFAGYVKNNVDLEQQVKEAREFFDEE